MNKLPAKLFSILALFSLVALLGSCLSINLGQMKDDELIAAGVDKWNQKSPEDAKPYWNSIRKAEVKAQYLGYITEKTAIEADTDALLAIPISPEADYLKAFDALAARYAAFPKELHLSDNFRSQLRPQTVELVTAMAKAGRAEQARAFIKKATAFLGGSGEYDAFIKADDTLLAIKSQEKAAGRLLVKARSEEDFDNKIKGYETAISAYGKVDATTTDEIKQSSLPEDSPLAVFQATIRKNRSAATVEMEKALRQRQASFNERIGAIFAKTPEDDQLGNMTPEDLLKFHEGIRDDVNQAYNELTAFAAKYPKVIDKDMIKDVEVEKANLDVRITQITDEIHKMQEEAKRNKAIAAEFASRGKVALPLMIGLFNPQPGTSADSKKSRPAKIKGTIPGTADYWWGMISIDKGSKDDLVVTMSDNKEVQVYADNPKKGEATGNMKNLISMKDKVGRSWPVINAAKYLTNERYYLQLKKNDAAAYSGEVVIYKSFISRMR